MKVKLPLLLSILFLCTLILNGQIDQPKNVEPIYDGYRQNSILDLVLIYQGGYQRMDWTADQIYPYVIHTNKHNKKDWFFDGFLFHEFGDGKQYSFQHSYSGNVEYAGKEQWAWLAERHFEEGKAIKALNTCIEKGISEIGKPAFKHKIVIGLPEAQQDWKNWGAIDGKKLDFSKREDRIAASKWYIDLIIKKFEESNLNNLELAGIYWINEQMITSDYITVEIGNYVRSKGMQFYWIPYYMGVGYSEWREYGFDIAYLQPTYFFNKAIPDDRVDNTCRLARTHNMGLEMEFDAAALVNNPKNHRDRLIGYIESFKNNDVYKNSSIAYYEGGAGVYQFSKSKYWEDQLMMDTLHYFVKNRQTRMLKNKLYSQRFDKSVKELSTDVWNIKGSRNNIKIADSGLNVSSVNLNTKDKLNLTYGRIEMKAKILAGKGDCNIRIRLLPVTPKFEAWHDSGEILLMNYDSKTPDYIRMGLNTEQLNEVKGNMRSTIYYLEENKDRLYTIICEWKNDRIMIYVNDELAYAHENLFNKNDQNYLRFWPFQDSFYFDIDVDSKSKTPVLGIESLSIFKE